MNNCRLIRPGVLEVDTRSGVRFLISEWQWIVVRDWSWRLNKDGYLITGGGADGLQTRRLHRYLMNAMPWQWVDHANAVRSDNRHENLRFATPRQNAQNSASKAPNPYGYRGVKRCREAWQARIRVDGEVVHLGTFDSPELAHAAYCSAADKYHGEFARYV